MPMSFSVCHRKVFRVEIDLPKECVLAGGEVGKEEVGGG